MSALQIERRIRWYQEPFHRYLLTAPSPRAIEIAHRRWGKDEVVLDAECQLAHRRIGTYWHCLPEYAQARKALWTAVNAHTGKRRIDELFPPELRETTQEQEMFIRFKSGSTWQLIGSDRYDATVGSGPVFIGYSEWALANPSAWAYHRPMLEENGGGAAFITTPRGRNHAFTMYNMAVADMARGGRWFAELSSIHDTGALTKRQLDEAIAEYSALYGKDIGQAQFEQEYECSFNAAILGAFYAREMLQVRKEGRVKDIEPIPGYPVHRAWDIGVSDDTSIWWFQVVPGWVLVFDCYTAPDCNLPAIAEIVHSKPWDSSGAIDFVPHDAKVEEWGTGKTRLETMQRFKLNPQLVPMTSKLDGINAVRLTLPKTVFHPRCDDLGLSALEQYRRAWDDERKIFSVNEMRDWTTHLADAFRYLAQSWRNVQPAKLIEKPKPKTGQVVLLGPPEPKSGVRIKL